MSPRRFLDTNVLVYAVDRAEPRKREAAVTLLAHEARSLALSTQVLSEYFVTVTRKLHTPMSVDTARASVAALTNLSVIDVSAPLVLAAIDSAHRHQLSYWDALIVESAAAGGCTQLLTEDLNSGQTISGVEIVNPFVGVDS